MPRRLYAEKMNIHSSALCRRVQEQIPALIDGTASPQKRHPIEQHLASCTDCSTAYADYQRVEQLLGTARFALPAAGDLLPGFTARLESSGVEPANRILSKRRRINYALAAPAFALGAAAVAFVIGTSIAPRPGSSARHTSSPSNVSASNAIASRTSVKVDTSQMAAETHTPPETSAILPEGSSGKVPTRTASAEPLSRPVLASPEAAHTRADSIRAPLYKETARVNQRSSLSNYSKGIIAFADNFGYGLSNPLDTNAWADSGGTNARVTGHFKSRSSRQGPTSFGLSTVTLRQTREDFEIARVDRANTLKSTMPVLSDRLATDTITLSKRYDDSTNRGESTGSGSSDSDAASLALGMAYTSQNSPPEVYYYESESATKEADTTLVVQDDARGFTSVVQTVRKPVDTDDPDALRIEKDTDLEPGVLPGAGMGH